MYVRFHRKRLSDRINVHQPGLTSVRAVLVASTRLNGKPRQKTIAYLFSWIEGPDSLLGASRNPHNHVSDLSSRVHKWLWLDERLEALSLPPEQRANIDAAIDMRFPRPTSEQTQETLDRFWQLVGKPESAGR